MVKSKLVLSGVFLRRWVLVSIGFEVYGAAFAICLTYEIFSGSTSEVDLAIDGEK